MQRLIAVSLQFHQGRRPDLFDDSDKVLLPPSRPLDMPESGAVVFRLTRDPPSDRSTLCGVFEYTAHEGYVVVPRVVARGLDLDDADPGQMVHLQRVATPPSAKRVSLEIVTGLRAARARGDEAELAEILSRLLARFTVLQQGQNVWLEWEELPVHIAVRGLWIADGVPAPSVLVAEGDMQLSLTYEAVPAPLPAPVPAAVEPPPVPAPVPAPMPAPLPAHVPAPEDTGGGRGHVLGTGGGGRGNVLREMVQRGELGALRPAAVRRALLRRRPAPRGTALGKRS